MNIIKNEPLVSIGVLVTAIIGLLIAFGVPVTPAQSSSIQEFTLAFTPLITTIVGRFFVSPAWKVQAAREGKL